ncbi:hypothetical protein BDQ12DRAFT_668284 [Crucibulum laeve]|uniref:Uncharacterized protein n=1 Tax=Crucibulum laeve TaxID=68775 RepID=A0A5C3LUX4_9AGAR|nr:hypothetical protein BDQ12DRAFT_668284 [Crucibulum laeve]
MPCQTHSSTATGDPTAAAADLPTVSTATTAKAQKQAISGANIIEAKSKKVKTATNTEENNNNGRKGRKVQKGRKQGRGHKNKKHDNNEEAASTTIAKAVLETSGINKYGENLVTLSDDGSTNSDGGSTNENYNHSNNSGVNKKGTLISKASTPTYAEVLMAGSINSTTTSTTICNANTTSTDVAPNIAENTTNSTGVAPNSAKSTTTLTDTPISQTIWPVLESLSQKYSPVKGSQHHATAISHAQTPHTTVTAVSDDESDQEEKPIPRLKLAQLLGANESFLSDASQKCSGLPIAYGHYKAYLNAHRAFDQLTASGKWPSKHKLPVEEDIIQLFIARSQTIQKCSNGSIENSWI